MTYSMGEAMPFKKGQVQLKCKDREKLRIALWSLTHVWGLPGSSGTHALFTRSKQIEDTTFSCAIWSFR